MPKHSFLTVSEKFLEYAEEAASYFENHGYTVHAEKAELGFPYTPTLVCRRTNTTIIVELSTRLVSERIDEWVAYAKSSGKDTRIALAFPPKIELSLEQETFLRERGVGFYSASGAGLSERIIPRDLNLTVSLPQIGSLPPRLRRELGSAYEQFEGSHWREAFEDACQALERASRQYLKTGVQRGRITLVTKKGNRTLTQKQIDKLTMGQLAEAFSQIQNQTQADSILGQTLAKINKDRVGVAHHKTRLRTEKSLRANVGQHMWSIIMALKQIR